MTYKITSEQNNRKVVEKVTGIWQLHDTLSDLKAMGYQVNEVKRVLL